ncbi:DUF317 domain-containing protein [Streptomyces sp. NBC_01622]|uniref:DUF317 domain-containing protein n=1 Tax=Streptomyces sp. NBC_01622 TaxID=2975903 RepID=UPI003869CC9A|nr:DUF317 domain-containing protein [Streptomyces sp. NBC_01622]
MPSTSPDAPVRLDTQVQLGVHPAHPTAVVARLTGSRHRTAQALLAAHGFDSLDERTMVLARIDSEEPYWAEKATHSLHAEGITTEITPNLREAIDEEWTWVNYPASRLSRDEIRECSDQAQKIHEAIRDGRLVIHAHAHAEDSWDTVAVGTYRDTGKSVHLAGENHLRHVTGAFASPAQALIAFEQARGKAVRPGPAPMTATERHTAHARANLTPPDTAPTDTVAPSVEQVPAYAADPGDHEAVFNIFLDNNGDWEKYRTWHDNTTIANHESLTLRILFDADPRDATWTLAAYESPVSERMWHMALTSTVPAPVLGTLLSALTAGDAEDTSLGTPIETTVTEAVRPLADVGWTSSVDGRWMRWSTEQGEVGVQFDVFAAHDSQLLDTWTLWAGPSINHPAWTIRASAYTPAGFLSALSGELAHGIGTRRTVSRTTAPSRQHTAALPPAPPPPQPSASRH